MENIQSYLVASLTVCSVYVVYVYIYSSHKLLRTNVLTRERLPSFMYLYIKYLTKAVTRRTGRLYAPTTGKSEVVYTVFNCRHETPLLRRFCSLAGYGWDYPDTDFRDIPLCFPEYLCRRLLLMVLTDGKFSLSPAGLVRLHQILKTVQPVDELKKGPFMLQAGVQEYRQIDTGVEVVLCLSAISRTGCPVWESVLTMLSKNTRFNKPTRCLPRIENESQPDQPVPEDVKQVELRVPRTTFSQCGWSFCDLAYRLLSVPAVLFGYRLPISPSLWMLSVCLAEIEKRKGVEVITAPVNVTANFKEPLLVPGRVTIMFWEKNQYQSSAQDLSFSMQQHGTNISHMEGLISSS